MAEEVVSRLSWVDVIIKVGVPSAIAVFSVYMVYTNLSKDVSDIKVAVAVHSVDMSTQMKLQEKIEKLLQQICANTATNNKERGLCFN